MLVLRAFKQAELELGRGEQNENGHGFSSLTGEHHPPREAAVECLGDRVTYAGLNCSKTRLFASSNFTEENAAEWGPVWEKSLPETLEAAI